MNHESPIRGKRNVRCSVFNSWYLQYSYKAMEYDNGGKGNAKERRNPTRKEKEKKRRESRQKWGCPSKVERDQKETMMDETPMKNRPSKRTPRWKTRSQISNSHVTLYHGLRPFALCNDGHSQSSIGALQDKLLVTPGTEEVTDGANQDEPSDNHKNVRYPLAGGDAR